MSGARYFLFRIGLKKGAIQAILIRSMRVRISAIGLVPNNPAP